MGEKSKNDSSVVKSTSAPRRPWLRPWITRFWIFDRRWLAETFSREQILDGLRTLLWVAPLTVLIWIYAEREQVTRKRGETIPFELASLDQGKLVSLKPPQDSNVIIDCEGPRARVEEVLRQIRVGRSRMPGLDIYVDTRNASSEIQLNLASVVANHPLFTQNGITVTRCQPERANVLVDPLIERDARIEIPPGVSTLDPATTTFDPQFVKVKGPQSALAAAELETGRPGQLIIYARVQDRPELKLPGARPVAGLALDLPAALRNNPQVEITPKTVDAVLQVRRPDTERKMPSMAVQSTVPFGFGERFDLRFEQSLPDVTLIGPADALNNLDRAGAKQPYADFTVSSADAGEPKMKPLEFRDLPAGVRVSDVDRDRQIRVEVVPKTGSSAP